MTLSTSHIHEDDAFFKDTVRSGNYQKTCEGIPGNICEADSRQNQLNFPKYKWTTWQNICTDDRAN